MLQQTEDVNVCPQQCHGTSKIPLEDNISKLENTQWLDLEINGGIAGRRGQSYWPRAFELAICTYRRPWSRLQAFDDVTTVPATQLVFVTETLISNGLLTASKSNNQHEQL